MNVPPFWLLLGGIIVASAAVFAARLFSPRPADGNLATVRLGGSEFRLELAATPAERARGLAGRDAVPADGGMLFQFDAPAPRTFWMKGMRVPIDIIWLSGGAIVGIAHGAAPPKAGAADADLTRYAPPEPADAAIELAAGRAAELGIAVGQRVEILLP